MKKLLLSLGAAAPLALGGVAFAQAKVPSNYQQDVSGGQAQISADTGAKTVAADVKSSEQVGGQVDEGEVEVDEQVEPQEAEMEDGEGADSGAEAAGQSGETGGSNR